MAKLSENARLKIMGLQAKKQYDKRKAAIQTLMRQHKYSAQEACEFYRNHLIKELGAVPFEVGCDLDDIREELNEHATTA